MNPYKIWVCYVWFFFMGTHLFLFSFYCSNFFYSVKHPSCLVLGIFQTYIHKQFSVTALINRGKKGKMLSSGLRKIKLIWLLIWNKIVFSFRVSKSFFTMPSCFETDWMQDPCFILLILQKCTLVFWHANGYKWAYYAAIWMWVQHLWMLKLAFSIPSVARTMGLYFLQFLSFVVAVAVVVKNVPRNTPKLTEIALGGKKDPETL